MSGQLSKRALKATIRAGWRRSSALVKGVRRPGVDIPAAIREAGNRNRKNALPTLDLWFVVFDEHLSWLSSLNLILTTALMASGGKHDQAAELRALVVITAKIAADFCAIRNLCASGFDMAAKTVLRSTSEYFEAAILLIEKPELAAEFVSAQDNHESNAFWHKHMSKAKSRSLIKGRWIRVLANESSGVFMSDRRNSCMDVLGMTSHASFFGGAFSTLVLATGEDSDEEYSPGIFGQRTRASEHTLFWAMLMNFELLMLCPELPFGDENKTRRLVTYTDGDNFHVHISKGRLSLIELSMQIISGQSHPDLLREIPEPSWIADLSPDN